MSKLIPEFASAGEPAPRQSWVAIVALIVSVFTTPLTTFLAPGVFGPWTKVGHFNSVFFPIPILTFASLSLTLIASIWLRYQAPVKGVVFVLTALALNVLSLTFYIGIAFMYHDFR